MTGCNTGRNIQKYKGAGASTLQDALENGNTASLDVVLQSPAVFIGDGGGLSNINASSTTGNLQAVTNNGATSTTKITLTNSATSLETTGNIVVSTNVYATEFYGDGGTLSNIAANKNFQDVTTLGNTSSLTISFTNPAESITTTGNVIVGTNVHATEFVGDGSSLTSLNADNINSGKLAIAQGGTGANTLNNLIEMGTHTSGDFVGTITGGNGISSSAGTSGEDTNHALSINLKSQGGLEFDNGQLGVDVKSTGGLELNNGELALDIKANHGLVLDTNELKIDLKSQGGLEFNSGQLGVDVKANHGLAIDTNELKIDLKSGGGLEFDSIDSYKMRVKLDDANTSGKLPVNKGGTANDTFTGGGVLYYDSSNTKFVSTDSGQTGDVLKINSSGVPDWGSDNVGGSSSVGTLSQVTTNGASTGDKITLSNTDVSLETSGNVVVGNNKFFKGDAGLLSNVATSSTTITSTSSEGDIMFTTASNTLNKDSNQRIKYNPGTSTLTIKDSQSGSNTLTSTTWSGQSSKVIVGTDNGGTVRSLVFVDGNSILKDGNDNLAWTPSSKSLRLGPSGGTSNTLTNILWSGKSSKIAIGNSDTSGDARPVLYGIDETANKDASDRLNWTPGGTHAGTLTIGTIGGTHSNITATTFTGTATKVTVTNESNPSGDSTAHAIPYLSGTILKSVAGTLKYKPSDGTLSAAKFSGDGSGLTHLDLDGTTNTGIVPVDHGGTGFGSYDIGNMLYASAEATFTKIGSPGGNNETKFLKYVTDGSGGLSSIGWGDPSVSQISIANNTSSTVHGITFAAGTGPQDIRSHESTLHYKPSTGTLTTSNIVTSGTGDSARNGISNTNSNHTLSIGTKIICEEEENSTHGDDALRVNGNVVVVDYILGNGRYLQGINIQQDSNGSDTFITNDGAPPQRTRLSRFNA